jgi:hypothetical protein
MTTKEVLQRRREIRAKTKKLVAKSSNNVYVNLENKTKTLWNVDNMKIVVALK